MARELSTQAIILKKQPLGEADELITFFSVDHGKLRGVARSVRMPKSKLQYSLQQLQQVKVSFAGGNLPTVTASEVVEAYPRMRERYGHVVVATYGAEFVLRYTPDEQAQPGLWDAFGALLSTLDGERQLSDIELLCELARFKIAALGAMGFAPGLPEGECAFSPAHGFTAGGGIPVPPACTRLLQQLHTESPVESTGEAAQQLNDFLSAFTTYQFERELKGERFSLAM